MLAVLVPAIDAVALVGALGMERINAEVGTLYATNFQISRHANELGDRLDVAAQTSLVLIATVGRPEQARLVAKLDELEPRIGGEIEALRRRTAPFPDEREKVERIAAGWREFVALRRTRALRATGFGRAETLANQRLAHRTDRLFERIRAVAAQISDGGVQDGAASKRHADDVYRRNLSLLALIALATLVASVGSVAVLVRNVVPRIRRYSRFAAGVRSGDSTKELHARGRDELADLGRALDEMVVRQGTDRRQGAMQAEFSQMMQVAETEEEAYDLLSRQLDRSVSGGSAVVLNRNNSADRLEAVGALPPESHLHERLLVAKPRSCLAVRFGRSHSEGPDAMS
jgi:hypothetical protein